MYSTLQNELESSCRDTHKLSTPQSRSVKSGKKCMKHAMRSMTPNSFKASPKALKPRIEVREECPAAFKLSMMSCKESKNVYRETPRSQTPKPSKSFQRDIYQPPIKLNGRNTPSMKESTRKLPKYLQNVDSKIKGDVKKDVEMFKIMMKIAGYDGNVNLMNQGDLNNSGLGRVSPCKPMEHMEMGNSGKNQDSLGYESFRNHTQPEPLQDRRERVDMREEIQKPQDKLLGSDRKPVQDRRERVDVREEMQKPQDKHLGSDRKPIQDRRERPDIREEIHKPQDKFLGSDRKPVQDRRERPNMREEIQKSQEKLQIFDRKPVPDRQDSSDKRDLLSSKRQSPTERQEPERKSIKNSKPPLFPVFEDTDRMTVYSAPSRQEEVSSYYIEPKATQGSADIFSQYQNLEDTFQKLDDKEIHPDKLRLESSPELHFDNEFETPRYPSEFKHHHKTTPLNHEKKKSLEDTGDLLNIAEGFLKNPLIAHLANKGSISFSVEDSPRKNSQSQPLTPLIQLSLEQSQGAFRKKWEEATRNIGKEEPAPIKWDDSKDLGLHIPVKSDSSFDFNTSSAQFEILQKFSEDPEAKAVDSSADYSFLKSQYFNMRYSKKGPVSEMLSHRSSLPMMETPSPSASIYDLEEYKLHPMYQDAHYSKYV